ncbi:hypothetical protein LR48_Vigan567s000200 [Vigna angularis]|uniref:S5 DRBM domain-containing protein n=1 Tax=Phaseolus angularis TaxID=3914 RepID=A0A0L9TDY3_PHAAN|nr:hypothetical protein LR48_Vigan567s000200 [Vigna angularis]
MLITEGLIPTDLAVPFSRIVKSSPSQNLSTLFSTVAILLQFPLLRASLSSPRRRTPGICRPSLLRRWPLKTEDEIAAAYEELYGPTFSGVSVLGNDVFEMDSLVKQDTGFGSTRRRTRAVFIVGNKNGQDCIGVGKTKEVVAAVQKSASDARRNIVKVPMTKYSTFPHRYTLNAHDDRYVVFDDVKVDMVDFENACADLGLELELEFAGFLNSLELSNEKLTGCTCLGGGCEICEEISSAICSASNYFAGAKEEIIMFKLDGNDPDEVASDQRTQVYSELSIPIEFSKVQYEFNALDLFKVEPIEPTLDYVPVMPAHTHILDSAFSIENIDMPYAVSELCTGFDIIPVDDSFTVGVHLAADLIDASEVIFEEPVQVESDFNPSTGIAEMHTRFHVLHALPDVPDTSKHFKLLDEISVVHNVKIPTDRCSEFKSLFSDNLFENLLNDCNVNTQVMMETHADFEFSDGIAELNKEEAAETKATLVEAIDGVNIAKGVLNVQKQLKNLNGELQLLQQMPKQENFNAAMETIHKGAEHNGENPISSFFSLLLNSSYSFYSCTYLLLFDLSMFLLIRKPYLLTH